MTNCVIQKNKFFFEFDDVYKEDDSDVLSLTDSHIQFTALSSNVLKISPVNFITGDYFEKYPTPSQLSH